MRNLAATLITTFVLCNCNGITSSFDNNTVNQYIEHDLSYSNSTDANTQDLIIGYSSLLLFTPRDIQKILLPEKSYTNLVFAVNSKNEPLFASFPDTYGRFNFGAETTSETLISFLITPFSATPEKEILNTIKSHDQFPKLVNRIHYLSKENRTFLNDKITNDLINDITHSFITTSSQVKDLSIDQILDYQVAEHNINLTLDSKLPFSVFSKDLVRNKVTITQVLSGLPLESSISTNDLNNVFFEAKNGAHELSIQSNHHSNIARVSKLAKDMILKSHILLGLETENYQSDNELEMLIKDVFLDHNLLNGISKSEAFKFVSNELEKKPEVVANYFLNRINIKNEERNNSTSFITHIRKILSAQKEHSFIFHNETFYKEFDELHSYNATSSICVENNKEVPCSIDVRKISYSIGDSGCFKDEYKIRFGSGFFAPFGLDTGSKVRVQWEFGPNGNSGLWLINIPDSKVKVNGRTRTTGCFNFGTTQELTLSISIKDHNDRESNVSSITIDRPKSKNTISSSVNSSAKLL